jgi:hypothetical protein
MSVARVIPKRIRDQQDASMSPGSGTNGYAIVYNHTSGKFELGTFEASGAAAAAVAAHVGLSNPHSQYLLSSGVSAYGATLIDDADAAAARTTLGLGTMATATETAYLLADGSRTGATSARQVFTQGITAPSWRPASDAALQLQNAAGTAITTLDTTNQRFIHWGTATFTNDPTWGPFNSAGGITVRSTNGSCLVIGRNQVNDSMLSFQGYYPTIGFNYFNNNSSNKYGASDAAFQLFQQLGGSRLSIASAPVGTTGTTPSFTERVVWTAAGYYGVGLNSPTALVDIAASTTARASLRVRAGTAPTTPNAGDIWDDGGLVAYNIDATTNAVVNSLKMRRGSSGTPAAGFGLGIAARLESTTTEDQDAGRLTYEWVTATHASRASRGKLSAYYTTTEQEAIRWDGDTAGLKLGFYGVAAVARQVLATGAGASVDNVISALQALGLVKQS